MELKRWEVPGPRGPLDVATLEEFEILAAAYLPRSIFGYARAGAEAEAAYNSSLAAFQDWTLAPRVLQGSIAPDTGGRIFGKRYSSIFGIAPMGGVALGKFRGDAEVAAAARADGVLQIISGGSTQTLEAQRAINPTAWMQVYLPAARDSAGNMVRRVANAGYEVMVVTVDTPVGGNRIHFERLGFSLPVRVSTTLIVDGLLHPRWLFGTALQTIVRDGVPHIENYGPTRGGPIVFTRKPAAIAPSKLTWDDIKAVRDQWRGKLVIKGILSPADAQIAASCGIDGIIVSNHGGRQFDAAPPPLRVLPDIVAAAPHLAVMIDGGIRWGSDLMKAYALGASFAFIGRPFYFANAVGGQRAVRHAIALLNAEVRRNMVMSGLSHISELDYGFMVPAGPRVLPPPAERHQPRRQSLP